MSLNVRLIRPRDRDRLISQERKKFWERKRANKTYEEWLLERTGNG